MFQGVHEQKRLLQSPSLPRGQDDMQALRKVLFESVKPEQACQKEPHLQHPHGVTGEPIFLK